MNDFDDAMMGPEPDENEIPKAEDIDRFLRWKRQWQEEMASHHGRYRRERMKLDAWWKATESRIQGQIDRLDASLAAYHAALLLEDPTRKTLHFPNGLLEATAQIPEWKYTDPVAFVAWARANAPELVRVKFEADKTAIKKALTVPDNGSSTVVPVTAEGEVVPGVEVIVRGNRFSAKPQ